MARFKKEGFKPRRTLKMALTCGEETAGAFNGAEYLAKNQRQLIDAAFAINEGGGGMFDVHETADMGIVGSKNFAVGLGRKVLNEFLCRGTRIGR